MDPRLQALADVIVTLVCRELVAVQDSGEIARPAAEGRPGVSVTRQVKHEHAKYSTGADAPI